MQQSVTFESALQDILTLYIATNPRLSSVHSAKRYRTTVNNFERWLKRPARLRDLTQDTYGLWVNERRGQVAAGTLRSDAEKLTVLWRWGAARAGGSIPPVILPSAAEVDAVAWTLDELDRLERAAQKAVGRIGGVACSLYWPAFIGVAMDTGERLRALHELTPEDIDWRRGKVTFRRETRKGWRRSQTRDLTPQTIAHLRRLIDCHPGQLFAVVQVGTLYRPLGNLLASAGLPQDRCRKFHCLRKTHATHLHIQGGDATASLDHDDPKTTWRHYIDKSQIPQKMVQRKPATLAEKLASPGRRWLRRLGFTG